MKAVARILSIFIRWLSEQSNLACLNRDQFDFILCLISVSERVKMPKRVKEIIPGEEHTHLFYNYPWKDGTKEKGGKND